MNPAALTDELTDLINVLIRELTHLLIKNPPFYNYWIDNFPHDKDNDVDREKNKDHGIEVMIPYNLQRTHNIKLA